MKPHNISIKRKKGFKLTFQKNKFVLFIGEDGKLDDELPLHSHMAVFIKKFTSKKVFKNDKLKMAYERKRTGRGFEAGTFFVDYEFKF